jgi:hypothetical protein
VASLQALAEGRADLVCIDAVTWRVLARADRVPKGLVIIGRTTHSPGQSFITRMGGLAQALFAAPHTALDQLPGKTRESLGLTGLVRLTRADYFDLPLPALPTRAIRGAA